MSADDLKVVINQNYPDIRKIINVLQLSPVENEDTIKIDKSVVVSSNYMIQSVKELMNHKGGSSTFTKIRQIIANANVNDFEEFYRFLYDNASKYLPGYEGTAAMYINEYSYQSNFRIDKEINIMALMHKLIELKEKKV